MTLEEQAQEFWWGANLWRRKQDEVAYEMLIQLRVNNQLAQPIVNRIIEIENAAGKVHNTGPLRVS